MNNSQREEASDRQAEPLMWYVYILKQRDGSLYIGQTNDLKTRLLEHRLDAGADATKGQQGELKWWNHCHSRKVAEHLEQRLQAALARSPLEIEGVIERFEEMMKLFRPEKSLADLRAEELAYDKEMRRAFHHAPVGPTFAMRKATCGWMGFLEDAPFHTEAELYGTDDWEALLQMERERNALESVGRKAQGRQPCQRCLALAPKPVRNSP